MRKGFKEMLHKIKDIYGKEAQRLSMSLVITKTWIKTVVRCHYTLPEMAEI